MLAAVEESKVGGRQVAQAIVFSLRKVNFSIELLYIFEFRLLQWIFS